jgi:hypothetical protein
LPELKMYRLFISHVWRKNSNSEYYRLERLLRSAPNFWFIDYSVPEHDPLGTKTNKELYAKLGEQIRQINCFLVISGMYVNHRDWIQAEIELAQHFNKPIIGVVPQGQERIPTQVQRASKILVGWNTASIVAAIRKYAL